MTYAEILRERLDAGEITLTDAVDFLTSHGVHYLKAFEILARAK